jgi:hypothetical protein
MKRGTEWIYSSYDAPYLANNHGSSAKGTNTSTIVPTRHATSVWTELATNAQPTNPTIKPTYCGFREKRYGPRRTSVPSSPKLDAIPSTVRAHNAKIFPPNQSGIPSIHRIHGTRFIEPQSIIPRATTPIPEIMKRHHIK